MSYPKWLYHKDQGAKIVNSSAEQKNLGSGWLESYAAKNIDVAQAQARAVVNVPKEELQPQIEQKPEPQKAPRRRGFKS